VITPTAIFRGKLKGVAVAGVVVAVAVVVVVVSPFN
jgi:hypothetical protein